MLRKGAMESLVFLFHRKLLLNGIVIYSFALVIDEGECEI